MANLIKKLAASKPVWQMTGLTYPTAVRATTGRFMSKDDYLISGKDEMSVFSRYINEDKSVLEFGCGMGRNLFGIAGKIREGYGIDVNPHYIKLANKITLKYNFKNLHFLRYDGANFPNIPIVDIILEKSVFERLNKPLVERYVKKLTELLTDGGIIILFFLMERAEGTEITKLLGDSAYVFWNNEEIEQLLKSMNLDIVEVLHTKDADYYICRKPESSKEITQF